VNFDIFAIHEALYQGFIDCFWGIFFASPVNRLISSRLEFLERLIRRSSAGQILFCCN